MLNTDRARKALELRAEVLRHHGRGVLCPICGHHFDRFRDDGNRRNTVCWRCGSTERNRAQWLLLERHPELLCEIDSLLHFAPEWSMRSRLGYMRHLRYVTADLSDPDVDLHLDVTALNLPDASFDAVICSHVLEHVDDDATAMRELRRITRQWCLIMAPLDAGRGDVGERLQNAGFAVERIEPARVFEPALVERCRLLPSDHMWLCRPPDSQR